MYLPQQPKGVGQWPIGGLDFGAINSDVMALSIFVIWVSLHSIINHQSVLNSNSGMWILSIEILEQKSLAVKWTGLNAHLDFELHVAMHPW